MNIARLQKTIGYQFNDEQYLIQALTHRSLGARNYERLEYLGDSILGFEVADYLYKKHQDASEGQLSRLRANLVNKETLAKVAKALDLGDYLILGPGELRSGGQNRDSILADALEATIAAVYLDAGIDRARQFIRQLLKEKLEASSPEKQTKDPKTRLQEYLQSRGLNLPDYEVISVAGSQHDQAFKVQCAVAELGLESTAEGKSRRKAEQQAAKLILSQIGVKG